MDVKVINVDNNEGSKNANNNEKKSIEVIPVSDRTEENNKIIPNSDLSNNENKNNEQKVAEKNDIIFERKYKSNYADYIAHQESNNKNSSEYNNKSNNINAFNFENLIHFTNLSKKKTGDMSKTNNTSN